MIIDLQPGTAGQGAEDRRDEALAILCEDYWYPVYAFIRRSGRAAVEAEDLTQSFFFKMVHGDVFGRADADRGRLRSFLLTNLSRLLITDWRKQRSLKRGGGEATLSLDAELAERYYQAEPKDDLTPEKLYDRRWATLMIDSVYSQLQDEFTARGKERQFELLSNSVTPGSGDLPYRDLGMELGMKEAAVRQAIRRLRLRFGELMRERIAFTVDNDQDVEEELRALLVAFQ